MKNQIEPGKTGKQTTPDNFTFYVDGTSGADTPPPLRGFFGWKGFTNASSNV
jgi:hypothetical protein